MATKSVARRALESALAAAMTIQETSDIANRLSVLTERESRTRARRQRQKAKQPPKVEAPRDDSSDEFILDYYPAVLTTPPTPTTPAAPPPPPLVIATEPEEAPQISDGCTRVVRFAGDGIDWDSTYPTARYNDQLTFRDPLGFLGPAATTSRTYTVEGGWEDERKQKEESADEAAWRDLMEKCYGK